MRNRFTPEEWEELRLLPFLLWRLLTASVPDRGKELLRQTLARIEAGAGVADPLHRELLAGTPRSDWERLISGLPDLPSPPEISAGGTFELWKRLRTIRAFLQKELTGEPATAFLRSVLVAHWTGPLQALPREERPRTKEAVTLLKTGLGLDPEAQPEA